MKRLAKVLIGVGILLMVVAVAWRPVAVPQLVKLPDNVDRTDVYTGTFVTYLDAATGATLATPKEVPLKIERHVKSVPGATGAHVALLEETATVAMGDQQLVQRNVYAVDRRTMKNVSDPRAWTFQPGNVVDRSGTYYLTMPMGVSSQGEDLAIWKPEAGTSYHITSTTPATGKAGGTGVVYLAGNMAEPIPVAAYERDALAAQGLPMELTPAQSSAQLAAAGVDVAAITPVLMQTLTPTELTAVSTAMSQPVPLNYYVFGHGRLGVEPDTGGLVELNGIVDGISVAPDTTSMASIIDILGTHQDVPAIASLVTTLKGMVAAGPQPVYEMQYTQTPESVTAAAKYASDQAAELQLAKVTIPLVALVAGFASVTAGGAILLRRQQQQHRRTRAVPVPAFGHKAI